MATNVMVSGFSGRPIAGRPVFISLRGRVVPVAQGEFTAAERAEKSRRRRDRLAEKASRHCCGGRMAAALRQALEA